MTATLSGGFRDAPTQSARAFRAILDALSRPGTIQTLSGPVTPPAPLSQAAGTLLLTLADATTPLHLAGDLDTPAVRDWLTFHSGAPLVGAGDAAFAVGTWDALLPLSRFFIGTSEYPDRAATLIVEMQDLSPNGARLSGPGIDGHAFLSLPEVTAFAANHRLSPLGFDCFLTAGDRLAGLPRSTRVEAA
jgi:alpha-D-ribose 1-methylphosphonate 5-triphosphate synthase subunit PhnH